MDASTLPDLDQLDSQALKSLILTLHEQVFSNQQEILAQREQLASREAEIEHLKLLIAKLRRLQFGRSSEKRTYQIAQLELRLEELETRQKKETAVGEPSTPASTAVRRPTRRFATASNLNCLQTKLRNRQFACRHSLQASRCERTALSNLYPTGQLTLGPSQRIPRPPTGLAALPQERCPSAASAIGFSDRLNERVRRLPGRSLVLKRSLNAIRF
jgi:hypothetical protein